MKWPWSAFLLAATFSFGMGNGMGAMGQISSQVDVVLIGAGAVTAIPLL